MLNELFEIPVKKNVWNFAEFNVMRFWNFTTKFCHCEPFHDKVKNQSTIWFLYLWDLNHCEVIISPKNMLMFIICKYFQH